MVDYYIRLTDIDFSGAGSDTDSAADPIEYHFSLIQNLNDKGEIPFSAIEADQPTNNQVLGFSGKTRELPIQWVLYDDGTDKSNGTLTSSGINDSRFSDGTVETIQEQITWLERYVHNPTLGASWRLFGGRFTDPDGSGSNAGTPVAVNTVRIKETADNPLRAAGVIKLKVGQVV